jgi:phosphoribosylanthranilate isomerase
MISKNILIKVCGMRDAENIREVEQLSKELSIINSQLSIDWMGFIFWPKSSRYVSERPNYMPAKCKRVGVFVDASIDDIRQHVADYALDIIQLHGHEDPDFVRALRADGSSPVIIKAFNIATKEDLESTEPYEGIVDYFLFDTKAQLPGGSGQQFDWSVLADYVGETPFLLSGGIGPNDAMSLRCFHHPQLAGIDLNSRFETAPAIKDVVALGCFLSQLSQ